MYCCTSNKNNASAQHFVAKYSMETYTLLAKLDSKMPHHYHLVWDSTRKALLSTQQFGRLSQFKDDNHHLINNRVGESYTSCLTSNGEFIITGGFNRAIYINKLKDDENGVT